MSKNRIVHTIWKEWHFSEISNICSSEKSMLYKCGCSYDFLTGAIGMTY